MVTYLYSFNPFIIINEIVVPQPQYCITAWAVGTPGEHTLGLNDQIGGPLF